MTTMTCVWKRLAGAGLMIALSGMPEIASAMQQPVPNETQSQAETAQAKPAVTSPQPATGQTAPDVQTTELPESPSSAQAPPASNSPQSVFQQSQQPAGTAAAEIGNATGVAASKPAGVAIAPAKQRQSRSFLIKMGAILGVGAAIGTVVALSSGSPSRPPGSTATQR